MDKFEQMVETIEEAEDMVECKECFDLFPKAECTKMDHGYLCPTCGRERPQDFSDVSFTDITTDLYDQEFPDVMDYDSEFKAQVDERRPDYDIDTMVDILVKDEFDAIDSYEVADEVIQHADGDEDVKDDLLDAIEHIKEEEEEHIEELNKAAGRVEEDPKDKDEDKDDDSKEDSDSKDEDDDKDEDEDDKDSEDEDKDEDEVKEALTEADNSKAGLGSINAGFEWLASQVNDLRDEAAKPLKNYANNIFPDYFRSEAQGVSKDGHYAPGAKYTYIATVALAADSDRATMLGLNDVLKAQVSGFNKDTVKLFYEKAANDFVCDATDKAFKSVNLSAEIVPMKNSIKANYSGQAMEAIFTLTVELSDDLGKWSAVKSESLDDSGAENLEEKKEKPLFNKLFKPVTESCTWVCKVKDKEIGTVEAATEEEAIEKMQKEYPEHNYGEYDGCFEVCQEAVEDEEEHETLTEAGFLTNLFTKENENLDLFFGSYKINVGNSTIKTLPKWSDAEKLAAQKSKANPTAAVSVSAMSKPTEELASQGWSAQFVKEFGGKDVVLATYRDGKVTLVDKAAALAKRLKAEVKANKIMNKNGASSEEYSDQYGRNSISDALKPSKVVPTAEVVKTLTNILFNKYIAIQGMARPISEEAKATGSEIQIAEIKPLGDFEDLASAAEEAVKKSSRVPEEGSGDIPVVEIYGYFKDFDDKTLAYLEKYVTRSSLGASKEASMKGGPVHLFTYSAGKAIEDEGCGSLFKFIKMKTNIIEDLEEAGYDTSGESNSNKDKKDPDPKKGDPNEEEDPGLEDETTGDSVEDLRKKALEILGEKEDAAKYTEESYEKYSVKYDEYLGKIQKVKRAETFKDSYLPKLPTLVDKLKALLELRPEADDLEDETDVPVDPDLDPDTEEKSSEFTGKLSDLSDIQLAKFYAALTGKGVGYADAEKTKLSDKWHSAMNKIRKKLQGLGESFASEDALTEKLKEALVESGDDFVEDEVECVWCNNMFPKSECRKEVDMGWLCDRCERAINSRGETLTFEEDLKTTSDAMTELKDTVSSLEGAISGMSNMADAMKG